MLKDKELQIYKETKKQQQAKKEAIDKAYKILLENRKKRMKNCKNDY